jgi:uncharacterized protein YdhG (YjbR/CyaY superfamily)
MQSSAADVDAYLQEAPDDRRPTLSKLRRLCLKTLVGFEEAMEYGLPSYKRNGAALVSFASQRNYISLYILNKTVLDKHRSELKAASVGKGCIRYSRPYKIDFGLVEKLLVGTRESKEGPC